MSQKIDEFKEFVKANPSLKKVMDKRGKRWQDLFEHWSILGEEKTLEELEELMKLIEHLQEILSSEENILKVIKEQANPKLWNKVFVQKIEEVIVELLSENKWDSIGVDVSDDKNTIILKKGMVIFMKKCFIILFKK